MASGAQMMAKTPTQIATVVRPESARLRVLTAVLAVSLDVEAAHYQSGVLIHPGRVSRRDETISPTALSAVMVNLTLYGVWTCSRRTRGVVSTRVIPPASSSLLGRRAVPEVPFVANVAQAGRPGE